jgi:hypothetical protein
MEVAMALLNAEASLVDRNASSDALLNIAQSVWSEVKREAEEYLMKLCRSDRGERLKRKFSNERAAGHFVRAMKLRNLDTMARLENTLTKGEEMA